VKVENFYVDINYNILLLFSHLLSTAFPNSFEITS